MINCTILIKNICCELHSYFIVNILPPLFFFFIITINLKSDFEITLHTKECGHKMNYWRWEKRIKNQWDVIRRFFSISIPKKKKIFSLFLQHHLFSWLAPGIVVWTGKRSLTCWISGVSVFSIDRILMDLRISRKSVSAIFTLFLYHLTTTH